MPLLTAISLTLDAERAAVHTRVAGLTQPEEAELDRRIRDELAAARPGHARVKINGRRTPTIGKE